MIIMIINIYTVLFLLCRFFTHRAVFSPSRKFSPIAQIFAHRAMFEVLLNYHFVNVRCVCFQYKVNAFDKVFNASTLRYEFPYSHGCCLLPSETNTAGSINKYITFVSKHLDYPFPTQWSMKPNEADDYVSFFKRNVHERFIYTGIVNKCKRVSFSLLMKSKSALKWDYNSESSYNLGANFLRAYAMLSQFVLETYAVIDIRSAPLLLINGIARIE